MFRSAKMLQRVRSSRFLFFTLVGLAIGISACYPGGATDVGDYDLVVTAFSEQFDFTAAQTYAMPDSVVPLDTSQTIPQSTQNVILQTIEDNMTAYGWTRILAPDTNNQPDVVILVSITTQDWAAWVSYPWWGYWGWYPYWGYYPPYGGGWGWYYPYPPTGTYYEYTVGTLLIDMAKGIPDNPADSLVTGVWGAGFNGLVSGSKANDQERLAKAIDQAFKQSPYLDTN